MQQLQTIVTRRFHAFDHHKVDTQIDIQVEDEPLEGNEQIITPAEKRKAIADLLRLRKRNRSRMILRHWGCQT